LLIASLVGYQAFEDLLPDALPYSVVTLSSRRF
jgi:hypothetical protein